VHEAELVLAPGADDRAPGGAITTVLCGHWEHAGPCRWPHHTAMDPAPGAHVTVRTIFASTAAEEQLVRDQIRTALRAGSLDGPTGRTTWRVVRDTASTLRADEQQLAAGLVRPANP
jgi:hypothetical protein